MSNPIFVCFLNKIKGIDRYFLLKHIKRRILKSKEFSKYIYDKLDEDENIILPQGTVFRFTNMKDGFSSLLNAKALPPNHIIVSPEWATRLLLHNSEDTYNAFYFTLGHEITHNEGDFTDRHAFFRNKKFINWVNETHADFGAADKMVSSNRQKLLDAIIYKKSFKNKKKQNKTYNTHPSWSQREFYATNFNFDDILIDQIAEDTGCTNKVLIRKIKEYYDDIVLVDDVTEI